MGLEKKEEIWQEKYGWGKKRRRGDLTRFTNFGTERRDLVSVRGPGKRGSCGGRT